MSLSSPILSFSAAAAWGAGDFSGGIATRRSPVFAVVAVAHAIGLAMMIVLAVLFREALPSRMELFWATASGLVGGAGLACLYRALAVGKMGLNAPLSAVIAVLVPLTFSFFREGLPHLWRLLGFVVALISIWLIASQTGTEASESLDKQASPAPSTGLALAIASGIGLGGFLLLIKFAGPTAIFWPLTFARIGSFGLMVTIILLTSDQWKPAAGSLRWVLIAGVLDTGANVLYVAAIHLGSLAVAAVLSSLYPASTVILARLVLKEKWSRRQGLGMVAALVAVGMISS